MSGLGYLGYRTASGARCDKHVPNEDEPTTVWAVNPDGEAHRPLLPVLREGVSAECARARSAPAQSLPAALWKACKVRVELHGVKGAVPKAPAPLISAPPTRLSGENGGVR
jgi:hypothetical protein